MSRPRNKLVPAALAATLLVGGSAMANLPVPDREDRIVIPAPPGKVDTQPHPGMTSEFYHMVNMLTGKSANDRLKVMAPPDTERFAPIVQLRGEKLDEIESYIWLEGWDEGTIKHLDFLGVEVTGQDEERFLLQAWIPLDRVEDVAGLAGVRELRRPSYGIPSAGSVISQGVSNLNAAFIRNLGNVNGLGVTVGVISVGLFGATGSFTVQSALSGSNNDTRISRGDLPRDPRSSNGQTSSFFGSTRLFPANFDAHSLANYPNPLIQQEYVTPPTFPEGAAILETILDIAPGYFQDPGDFMSPNPSQPREFLFADARTDIALQTARNWMTGPPLASHYRPNIIVDDMVFFDSGLFDGSSTISRRAQQIALDPALDIVYITAVGNYSVPTLSTGGTATQPVTPGRSPIFLTGLFSPVEVEQQQRFHNFASGRFTGLRDEALGIRPQGGIVDVVLVWDDIWDDQNPRAKKDLDLYLVPLNAPSISNAVASSTDRQNNSGRPIERLTTSLFSDDYGLVIARKDGQDTSKIPFALIILQGQVIANDAQYLTHGIPLNNADARAPVISVGALDATRGIQVMSPDSVPGLNPGPGRVVQNSFFRWYENQVAPAVVSYANTNVLSAGFIGPQSESVPGVFGGSSAAAAHVGGLVRLLRHSFRDIPAHDYYEILRDTRPLNQPFPNATRVSAETVAPFGNAPEFYRVNGFDTWANLRELRETGAQITPAKMAYIPTFGELAESIWEWSDTTVWDPAPRFGISSQGLTVTADGKVGVYGFIQTPVLELGTGENRTHKLDANKTYELTVRVGVDEADPTRVPHFRLRLFSARNDEGTIFHVASLNADADNVPKSIAGREYKLHWSPSSQTIANHGARFAFDLIHHDPRDNSNATFFIQDVTFRELP